MSAYDGTGRLKIEARMRAPSVGARQRSKQRKWRVLLSICLLLPALAALIGIVAWAISVEVANSATSNGPAASSSSQVGVGSSISRRQLHNSNSKPTAAAVQYHQFRRHLPATANGEHATASQQAASSRSSSSGPLEPQSPNSIVESVAAAVISSGGGNGNSGNPSTGQSGAAPGSPRRRAVMSAATTAEGHSQAKSESVAANSNKLQPARATPAADKQAARKAVKKVASTDEDDSRSTLLLTHLAQLGELSGSGSSDDADDTTTVAIAAAGSGAETAINSNNNLDQTLISSSVGSSSAPAREPDNDDSDSEIMATAAKEASDDADGSSANAAPYSTVAADGKSDRDAPTTAAASSEDEQAASSAESSKGAMDQRSRQQQAAGMMLMASAKNANHHKSRLLSEQKQKQLQQLYKQTNEQSTEVSSSQKSPTTPAATAIKPTKGGRFGNKFHRHHFHIEHSAPAASASALAAVGAPSATVQYRNDAAPEPSQVQDDEEVSFEAIASAISDTLTSASGSQSSAARPQAPGGGFDRPLRSILAAGQPTEGDTGLLPGLTGPNIESQSATATAAAVDLSAGSFVGVDGPAAVSMFQRRLVPVRRRTAGEHVAEVIDQIVERRKQANVSGPQIVVVAPVGGGASMKARSLTKTAVDPDDKQPSNIKNAKKAAPTGAETAKKSPKKAEAHTASTFSSSTSGKKQPKSVVKSSKLIGARLLGTSSAEDDPRIDKNADKSKDDSHARPARITYSERVEVIEDDDSSALLTKSSPLSRQGQQSKANEEGDIEERSSGPMSDLEPLEPEQEERDAADRSMLFPEDDQLNADEDEEELEPSIHISSHSSKPKSRWPRHELSASQTLERYTPLQQSPSNQHTSTSQLQAQTLPPSPSTGVSNNNNNDSPKLYSAEQLIREHVLKSKLKPKVAAAAPSQQQQPQRPQQVFSSSGDSSNRVLASHSQDFSRPQVSKNSNDKPALPAMAQSQSQQQPQLESLLSQQQLHKLQPTQQVKMVPTTIRPHPQSGHRQQQLQEPKEIGGDGHPGQADLNAFGSSIQSVRVPLFFEQRPTGAQPPLPPAGAGVPGNNRQQHSHETYQALESQPQPSMVNFQRQRQEQQYQHQNQAQANLASQEQAPSQHPNQPQYEQKLLTQPNSQQPQSQHLQSHQQQLQHHQLQQPQQAVAMAASSLQPAPQSAPLPVFADQVYNVPAHMAESVIQEIQRASPQIGMVNGQPTILSSTVVGQVPHQFRHQSPQQQQLMQAASSQQNPTYLTAPTQQQQQQAWNQMAAANLIAARMSTQLQQQYHQQQQLQQQRHVLANRNSVEASPVSVSVKSPMALVQPVAQMALRHLFSSLGQQQQQSVAPAAASASPSSTSAAAVQAPKAPQVSQESMLSAGTESTASTALALPSMDAMGGRSMRSLPSGPASSTDSHQPGAPRELQLAASGDQEVAESYGQMPAYHMGGGGGGSYGGSPQYYGGGGGGEGGYQSDHDKKSKGITFHFGGGPIGGGTQLITSPMGIFKHLMIPLLPNPRVNLNGKVVFGVVLEKSTAIGEPKKKYKFWG